MKFVKICMMMTALGLSLSTFAQFKQDVDACEPMIEAAEDDPSDEIYVECGFDDVQTALVHWAPLAEEKQWKNALYEIYRRHPNYPGIKTYAYKAAEFGHTKGLMLVGNELFEQGQVAKAMRYYNAASKGDLSEEDQGIVAGRIGLLYAKPDSPYYDPKRAIPLLQKAALQRQALANNIMGIYTLFGMNGLTYNTIEAFKYLYRAQLLGCRAAEENLGFFYLGKQGKLDGQVVYDELQKLMYSCDGIPTSDHNVQVYHLSFTPQECSSINYYAERLVDTSLPFVGKEECAFSADMSDLADNLTQKPEE